jgi:hypothetical protein
MSKRTDKALKLIKNPRRLHKSLENDKFIYGLGCSCQIAHGKAALFSNLRFPGMGHEDYEAGNDCFVYGKLSDIEEKNAIKINRNEYFTDSEGNQRVIAKEPLQIGFVPIGALLPDGSKHPHAGTGFGLGLVISLKLNKTGGFRWDQEKPQFFAELTQLKTDGASISAVSRGRFSVASIHTAAAKAFERKKLLGTEDNQWFFANIGLSAAIPDGKDGLLCGIRAENGKIMTSGVARWRYSNGQWALSSFAPVSDVSEPSLVRDVDGALLFTARKYDYEKKCGPCDVFRSADDGRTWELVLHADNLHEVTPITINSATDGTPYIATNPDRRLNLGIWELNKDRTSFISKKPLMIRDYPEDFGYGHWGIDHPNSSNLILEDGKPHNLLHYRVLFFVPAPARGNTQTGDMEIVKEQTGLYIDEIVSDRKAFSLWKFE